MRHLCYNRVLMLLFLLSTTLFGAERYAFIYSKNIDDQFISFYDKVVVEADSIDNIFAIRYPKKMVAYVSVGEIEPWRKTKTPYKKSWIISKNRTWNSLIADLNNKEYQDFIFQRVEKLYQKGYRNFFLDTMDAYHVTSKDKKLFKKQQKALISFVHKLHKKYPKSKIILNRGFELLDKIHNDISGVVAESLLSRYDHAHKKYLKVPKEDRDWLLNQFKKAQKYHLDTISIDYSDGSTKKRLEIAKKLKKLGVIPYVTDGMLQEQGECDIERIRRNVLILLNSSRFLNGNDAYSDVHLTLSMPIEHLGYIPILCDISKKELPKSVEDRYKAVVVWSEGKTKNSDKFYKWITNVKDRGIKILFLQNFIFPRTNKNLKEFNITLINNKNRFLDKSQTLYKNGYKPFEIKASIAYEEQIFTSKSAKPIVEVDYPNGQKSFPIALMPWGGYAYGFSFLPTINNESLWSIDPFKFLKESLNLNEIPVPDPTTESGRRILFTHVDGDGFMEVVRTNTEQLASKYLLEHIFKKYPIPQSISLIQGEVDSIGLYPKLSRRMKQIAKEIYKLPWIEPASHTLSHPFFWGEADKEFQQKSKRKTTKTKKIKHATEGHLQHLPIPNYPNFKLKRETTDSIDFALSLAPKNRQDKRILFWSGDCLPTRLVLAYTEREGDITMNGGDTTMTQKNPYLSRVAPFGIQREEYWQIYTGEQNENVYTNDWLGPFWGYRDAISTFKLTENPRRLKPINIYYHFYSGSKLASSNALDEVYKWAIRQQTSKLYASQFIKKSRGFYRTAIAKIAGGYEIRNSGFLRTIRFDKRVHIDMQKSQGVAGYTYTRNRTYITLDRRENHTIILANRTTLPYLKDCNGWAEEVKVDRNSIRVKLKSNVPLEANFYLHKGCEYHLNTPFKVSRKKSLLSIISKSKKRVTIAFKCK